MRSYRLALPAFILIVSSVPAQAQSPSPAPAKVRKLDRISEDMQSRFVEGLDKLANDYEALGELDKAKEVLRRRLDMADSEDAQNLLDEWEERDFDQNKVDIELPATATWTNTYVDVRAGESVRIVAEGKYRLNINAEMPLAGMPSENVQTDLSTGVPFGALTAIVFPPKGAGEGRRRRGPRNNVPQPSEPLAVGTELQFEPDISGRLFLKLNIPSSAKVIGKLKVTVSGKITAKQ